MADRVDVSSNIPPLQNGADLEAEQKDRKFLEEDEWFDIDVSKDYLDFSIPYEKPKYTLSFRGIPFAPLGGIQTLTGQAGNGKTALFTQFIAAILGGSFGELKYELSDRVPNPTVLYIDTEMELDNTIIVKNRLCEILDWDPQQQPDNLKIMRLRETVGAKEKWRKTVKAIDEVKPTVVFLDGLLDEIEDFNSVTESQALTSKCSLIATRYNISFWCLVHSNPNKSQDYDKMVGHLGSFLERKVSDKFFVTKNKDEKTGEIKFNVKQTKARGRDLPSFDFRIDFNDRFGKIVPMTVFNPKECANIKSWLVEKMNDVQWPATEAKIKKLFKCYVNTETDIKRCIDIAVRLGHLTRQTTGKGKKTTYKYSINLKSY